MPWCWQKDHADAYTHPSKSMLAAANNFFRTLLTLYFSIQGGIVQSFDHIDLKNQLYIKTQTTRCIKLSWNPLEKSSLILSSPFASAVLCALCNWTLHICPPTISTLWAEVRTCRTSHCTFHCEATAPAHVSRGRYVWRPSLGYLRCRGLHATAGEADSCGRHGDQVPSMIL